METYSMNLLSVIVPIAPRDLQYSFLLFKSLEKNFNIKDIATVFITFPEKHKLQNILNTMALPFKCTVLTEEELIPESDYPLFRKSKGWLRQQIVKFYISKLITTDFYICLDADLLCYKPTCYSDLIINNKPIVNMESKSLHHLWWTASAKALKMKKSEISEGMGSSTNIFITSEVIDLMKHIEQSHHKSCIQYLLNWYWKCMNTFGGRQWTEYTLYWLFLELRGHTFKYDMNHKILGNSIWKATTEEINDDMFKKIFSMDNDGYFVVYQSTRVAEEVIYEKAKKYLGISIPDIKKS